MDSEANFDCFICHAHATGFHFGAQSCQACCAFFRRAVSLKRQYICQQKKKSGSNIKEFNKNGENEESENSSSILCDIHFSKCIKYLLEKQKILCRSCRFQKCLSVGMNPNNVQTPQKTNINAKNGRNYFTKSGLERNKKFAKGALKIFEKIDIITVSPIESTTSSSSLSPSIHSPSTSSSTNCSSTKRGNTPLNLSIQQPSPLFSSSSINNNNNDLLSLLVKEEMRIAERRRILFCERPVACLLGESKNCPFTREDIKPLSFQEFRRSIRTHILLVYEWLRVWPAFSELNMKDRVTLLRKCVLYHTVLDPCFLTIQMGDLEKFVLPNGGYVSTKFPPLDEGCWADEPEISHETKIKIYWPLLVPLMSGSLPDISFTGRALVSRELDSLCSSLYKFYGSQTEFNSNPLEKAERFGNLILLLTPIIDTANTFVESHHIVQFFDLWQMDSLMLQFLQNKSS
uniref:Nuclear receptor n=1 Tax=Meloidogyne floridensis TaxID=298350 RepID=A0A915PGS7_9BILA